MGADVSDQSDVSDRSDELCAAIRRRCRGLQFFAGEGVDEAFGGDVDDLSVDMSGEAFDGVVGAECYIETVENLMQRIVHIFGVDSLHFFLVFAIEMRLNRNYIIVVVDRECLGPRVVGAGYIDFVVSAKQSYHKRRDEHITRAGHA